MSSSDRSERQFSSERLTATLEENALIGRTPDGGVSRQALTAADRELRDRFVSWCAEAGCEIRVDEIGNVFARRRGLRADLPPVVVGSHLDSQVAAGPYDGALGVLAGLEVLRALNDAHVTTERAIEVVSWTNEEGVRFLPPMMGSGVFAGRHDLERMLSVEDAEGVTVADALAGIGYDGSAAVGSPVDSYFELHIEQGSELERHGLCVGLVTRAYPVLGLRASFFGETAHAGPTPMKLRRNALVAAAQAVVELDAIARSTGDGAKSTSTVIDVWPNRRAIIPSRAEVMMDMRHPDREQLETMLARATEAFEAAAEQCRVEFALNETYEFGGFEFDPECLRLLEDAAGELKIPFMPILAQAGHDAYNLARVAPTALIFCPCRDGVSHHPAEAIDLDQVLPAVDLLLHSVVNRANRPDDSERAKQ